MPQDESNQQGGVSPQSPAPAEFASTIYTHLRAIAQYQMNGERVGHSLSATALVHEAYLRLENHPGVRDRGAEGFYHAAAEAMRRILIEHARARGRVKRGGGRAKVSLDAIGDVADLDAASGADVDAVFAFDDAFRRLELHDIQVADVVRLRFFGGLSVPQAARALAISERTVNNRWAYARAWLARDVARAEAESVSGAEQ